jgi:glutamate dehydrogenase
MLQRETLAPGLAAVVDRATALADPPEHELVAAFATEFFSEIGDDELGQRSTDLAAAAIEHLRFGRRRAPGETLVDVRPAVDRKHSMLLVVNEDAPFLIDTIRLALDRLGVEIFLMVHPWLDVVRDADGTLVDVATGPPAADEHRPPNNGIVREAWTEMEISRCSPALAAAVDAAVRSAVADVQSVVGDSDAMHARATEVGDQLSQAPVEGHTATEGDQVAKLLHWLTRGHFVFLAAAAYEVIDLVEPRSGSLIGGSAQQSLSVVEGSQLGLMRSRRAGFGDRIDPPFAGGSQLLSIARTDLEVEIHRHARPVCVAVRRVDARGRVIGEHRFWGLFSSAAYRASVTTIPLIRERVAWVLTRSHFDPTSHTGRALRTVLENFPRDVIFEIDRDELAHVSMAMVGMQERSLVRLLQLHSPENNWQTLAVYLPRSRVTPEVPERIAQLIATSTGASQMEFEPFLSTSALARVVVEIRRAVPLSDHDLDRLAAEVDELTQSWYDKVRVALADALGDAAAERLSRHLGDDLPTDYQFLTPAALAVRDVSTIDRMLNRGDTTATDVIDVDGAPDERRFRLYRRNSPVTLADLLPLLDQLGLQAIDERPFTLRVGEETFSIYDVGVRVAVGAGVTAAALDEAQSTFRKLLRGEVEGDGFNRLVLAAGLTSREVEIVRCYAKYLRQTTFPFSQAYIESTVVKYPAVVAMLSRLFNARFDPAAHRDPAEREAAVAGLRAQLAPLLEAIPSLDEDRICRTIGDLIMATVRTNAFRPGPDGGKRPVISLKLQPAKVADLPLPRPMFEIWVCSPRVEGVHLRGGRIARGGLRWSDRREDFRTEVLGLMKAQMVKNAVIVPVGSKGGFVVKRPPADSGELRQEVVDCYSEFVAGMLDLTDNIVGGAVVAPPDVVRYDADDPYLVVAADKGTATFSDVANGISEAYGFWLGDAFASGGSVGYDHKAMGITARGAWESVRRHAQVIGRNADKDPLTIVGVGDMSGDVFGNGLLRSPHVKLVAAFDHRHIFLDPDPDPQTSFDERQRLFDLPRSSWADYDTRAISPGGGVFARTEKSIPLSPEVRKRLGVDADEMTPNELMSAVLRAPVDLLWNGGIGTYVKASTENHAEVGDRANDAIRINGSELRCRIVGEGGNLGFTQRGRVEFALAGGLINTDAIDNSAGVDCSDHEVNIKILLNACVHAGTLSVEDRNAFLASMTDEVGDLVLDDNRAQTLALTMARRQAFPMVNVHARYLQALEADGWLDRSLEFLPTDRQLAERQAAGQGLTTPEFSVLMAYTKNGNAAEIMRSDLPDDPYLEAELVRYFPKAMQVRYAAEIRSHQLRREIVTTQLVNQMVNLSGISFDHRVTEQTGAGVVDIARAWVAARDITRVSALWEAVEALGADVKLEAQLDLLLEARRMTERCVLWLLRHRRAPIDLGATVNEFGTELERLARHYPDALRGQLGAITHSTWAGRLAAGVPDALAERSSVWPLLHTAFDVIDVATRNRTDSVPVAGMYWDLFDRLDVLWLWEGIGALPRSTRWETQARSALRDDLLSGLAQLTEEVLRSGGDVTTWLAANERSVARVTALFTDVRRTDTFDITTLTVGLRQLRNLTLATN